MISSTRLVSVILVLLLMGACDDESKDEGEPQPQEQSVNLNFGTLIDQKTESITASEGGTVSLTNATVYVEQNTINQDTDVSLYEIEIPTKNVASIDGALAGQVLLTDTAFVLGVSQDVIFTKPITLELKVDTSRIPAGSTLDNFHIATSIGGVVVPQGKPDAFDAENGTVKISFNPGKLKQDYSHQKTSIPPMAAGFPFLLIADKVALLAVAGTAVSSIWNPLMVTVDDLTTTVTMTTWNTPNFNITYRGDNVETSDVITVGAALEDAYDLFVTEMKFSLPNMINLDGQYTVFLDDFKNHHYLNLTSGTEADGFTLPGSMLFEGASYVNNTKPKSKWATTAVHEYFHALQFGELVTVTPNLWHRTVYSESGWLFEGSATALSGRVVNGYSTTPARDTSLGTHLSQGLSLFNPEQLPAADVAQDFFYYLEKSFAHADFYRPMFWGLSLEGFSDSPASVNSVNKVISESDDSGVDNLSNTWSNFIYDATIENELEYVNINPAQRFTLNTNGSASTYHQKMPSLSYYMIDFRVPPLDSTKPDNIQSQDIELSFKLETTDAVDIEVFILAQKSGVTENGYPIKTPLIAGLPSEIELIDFRTDKTNLIRVVLVNKNIQRDANVDINVSAKLKSFDEYGYHVAYNYYKSGSTEYGVQVMNLSNGSKWTVQQSSELMSLSASGDVLIRMDTDGPDKFINRASWGKAEAVDLAQSSECPISSYAYDFNISMTDIGRIYMPGTYKYFQAVQRDGEVEYIERTNQGIISCMSDGAGYVNLRSDWNSDGTVDSSDSFSPRKLVVAKQGRPLAFSAYREVKGVYAEWLAVIDSSGAGLRWLTDEFQEDLSISDDGSQIVFELDDGSGHIATMPTSGGSPIDLDVSTGVQLFTNGAGISPDGSTIAAMYYDNNPTAPDVGIVLINSYNGSVKKKLSTILKVMPDTAQPQFTPDGQFMIFAGIEATQTATNSDIYMMKIDGSGLRNLTQTKDDSEYNPLVR